MPMTFTREFALKTTAWMINRLEHDFGGILPLGVRDALHNVLDVIDKERENL